MYILKLLLILHLLVLTQVEAQRKIFAGATVDSTKDLPFIVAIVVLEGRVKGGKKISRCAGTYIKPKWILSAAHCVEKQMPFKNNKPKLDIDLCMGEVNIEKCPKENQRKADGVYPHTDGAPAYKENDVLLLHIEKPWPLGPTIQLAKVPTSKVDKKTYHNQKCLIGGWGSLDKNENVPDILTQATVVVVVGDQKKCELELGKRGEREICVRGDSGITCKGDSGGPLLCGGVVIGILRGGHGECSSITGKTSFYNMIQEYNDWIATIASGSRIVPNNLCLFVFSGILIKIY